MDVRLAQEARVNEALQAQLGELRRESLFMSGALAALQARLNEKSDPPPASAAMPSAHATERAVDISSLALSHPPSQMHPTPTALIASPAVPAPQLPTAEVPVAPSSALPPQRAAPLSVIASDALSAIVRDSEAVARAIFEANTIDEARVAGMRPLRLLESAAPSDAGTRTTSPAPFTADKLFEATIAPASAGRESTPRESMHDAGTSFRSSPLRISSYAGALPLSARRAIYVRPLAPSSARVAAVNAAQTAASLPASTKAESPGASHAISPSGEVGPLTPLTQAAAWHTTAAIINAPLGVTAPTTLPLGAALALLPLLVPPSDSSIDAALFGLRGGMAYPAPTSANSALAHSLHVVGPLAEATSSGDRPNITTTRAMLASARAVAYAPR